MKANLSTILNCQTRFTFYELMDGFVLWSMAKRTWANDDDDDSNEEEDEHKKKIYTAHIQQT